MRIKKRMEALAATLCQDHPLYESCRALLDVWRHEEVFFIYEPLLLPKKIYSGQPVMYSLMNVAKSKKLSVPSPL